MKTITEGTTKLRVHTGKISRKLPVFFNPDKEFDRSLSVIFIKSLDRKLKMLDLLSAGGARGIRILNESGNISELHLNDMNPKAVKETKENLKINNLKAEVTNMDSREFLASTKKLFDYIDIDPFGSPNPFLELSASKLRNKGFLSITATDCGALYGTYPKAGLRKYHSRTAKTNYSHELGLRIMVKHAIEKAAEQEIALTPILVHQTRHYFRAYFEAEKGAKKCDNLLKQFKFIVHCSKCLRRRIADFPSHECECGNILTTIGPVFAGRLQNVKLLEKMKSYSDEKMSNFLQKLIDEENVGSVGFYNVAKLAGVTRTEVPKMDKLIENLQDGGFKASRTHIDGQGLKTNADYDSVVGAMK